VAYVDGPNMNPPVTQEQACNFSLAYWEWEACYDSTSSKPPYPVTSSSLWQDPTLFGVCNVTNTTTYYVYQGMFSINNWSMLYPVGANTLNFQQKTSPFYDNVLKRVFNYEMFSVDAAQIIQAIISKIDYKDWLIWLAGAGHNGMHLFLSFPMQTIHSPDDPIFFMHHCNIDRFQHLWADCLGYDLIESTVLGPNQYSSVNPTSGGTVTDPNTGSACTCGIDQQMEMYYYSTTKAVWLPSTIWPTPRQLWTLGNNCSCTGWNGIYYRYGADKIVETFGSVCTNGGPWSWVNVSNDENPSRKRDVGTDAEDAYYQTSAETWRILTVEQGMSPQDALLKMAMDNCNANPAKPLTPEEKQHMGMMHFSPEAIKRICDTDPDASELEPVETPDAGHSEMNLQVVESEETSGAGHSEMTHQGHSFRK